MISITKMLYLPAFCKASCDDEGYKCCISVLCLTNYGDKDCKRIVSLGYTWQSYVDAYKLLASASYACLSYDGDDYTRVVSPAYA